MARTIAERLGRRAGDGPRFNVASYLTAPSGMGESARSMQRVLQHAGAAVRQCILPHPDAHAGPPVTPSYFGWPSASAAASITVANADSVDAIRTILPSHFWTDRNVGYWVWETEELPPRYQDAARQYSEIWSPSEYSAAAIRRTVGTDVVVVPHTLDLDALAAAKADRACFGLPAEATLFGFMFDLQSVIERKNLRGLLAAFTAAFATSEDVYLVIKVIGQARNAFDYKWLRAQMEHPRILYLENTLTRAQTFDLMASLDVYVSLHRSEGFGLTCAEAMALGKPVIATGYSGNLDFMSNQNSALVPARIIETDRAYGPYPAGSRWGEPNLEATVEAMRGMLNSEWRLELGKVAASDILQRLDIANIAATVGQRLNLGALRATPLRRAARSV
jgi:glycosyltransferase involved in cell wall biosynthesis